MIVVDTNIAAYYFISGERTAQADAAMNKDADWNVPRLWRSEFRNVLATRLRVQQMSLETAMATMVEAGEFFRHREQEVPSAIVLSLSHRTGVSAYDCEFVALAQLLAVPLITVDRKLAAAFPETALVLTDWLST